MNESTEWNLSISVRFYCEIFELMFALVSTSLEEILDKLVDESYLEKVQNFMKFYRAEKKKFSKEKKSLREKLVGTFFSCYIYRSSQLFFCCFFPK